MEPPETGPPGTGDTTFAEMGDMINQEMSHCRKSLIAASQ